MYMEYCDKADSLTEKVREVSDSFKHTLSQPASSTKSARLKIILLLVLFI